MDNKSVGIPSAWILSEQGTQVPENVRVSRPCIRLLRSVVSGADAWALQHEPWDILCKADARISQSLDASST